MAKMGPWEFIKISSSKQRLVMNVKQYRKKFARTTRRSNFELVSKIYSRFWYLQSRLHGARTPQSRTSVLLSGFEVSRLARKIISLLSFCRVQLGREGSNKIIDWFYFSYSSSNDLVKLYNKHFVRNLLMFSDWHNYQNCYNKYLSSLKTRTVVWIDHSRTVMGNNGLAGCFRGVVTPPWYIFCYLSRIGIVIYYENWAAKV